VSYIRCHLLDSRREIEGGKKEEKLISRVTLEYAQVNTSRPFDTPSYALAIPLPTAISAFVIPSTNRRSANFFDLLEGLEVWRILGGEGDVGWGRIPT